MQTFQQSQQNQDHLNYGSHQMQSHVQNTHQVDISGGKNLPQVIMQYNVAHYNEQVRVMVSRILDTFVEKFRMYLVYKLQMKYQEHYIIAAKTGGPQDQMPGIEKIGQQQKNGNFKYHFKDNPEHWDMSVLITIFLDHYKLIPLEEDFPCILKARSLLFQIKDIRNKRAHDNPLTSGEAYRIADTVQQFFEIPNFKEVVSIFTELRLQALDLHFNDERERYNVKIQQQSQQSQQNQHQFQLVEVPTTQAIQNPMAHQIQPSQTAAQFNNQIYVPQINSMGNQMQMNDQTHHNQNMFSQPQQQAITGATTGLAQHSFQRQSSSNLSQGKVRYNMDDNQQMQQQQQNQFSQQQQMSIDKQMKQMTSVGEFEIIM
eukprot:403375332